MRRLALFLLPLLLFGCGGGAYKMPREEYRERVKTLGVLPLMVDEESTIRYPQRQELVDLLRRHSSGREEKLAETVRESKSYFDVRVVPGDPRELFRRLVKGSSLRGQGDALYRRYQFDGAAAAEIASENRVDALLVVVLNGVERVEKRRDRGTSLAYLEAPYNSIQTTSAVVLPSGELAWEHGGEPGEVFLPLQYPDFDEAHHNNTDAVKIKFVTLTGLERALTEPAKGMMVRVQYPGIYLVLFEKIASALDPGPINPLTRKEAPAPAPPAR